MLKACITRKSLLSRKFFSRGPYLLAADGKLAASKILLVSFKETAYFGVT